MWRTNNVICLNVDNGEKHGLKTRVLKCLNSHNLGFYSNINSNSDNIIEFFCLNALLESISPTLRHKVQMCHQGSMSSTLYSFYSRRSQKRKKDSQVVSLCMLSESLCIKAECKNVDEIDSRTRCLMKRCNSVFQQNCAQFYQSKQLDVASNFYTSSFVPERSA